MTSGKSPLDVIPSPCTSPFQPIVSRHPAVNHSSTFHTVQQRLNSRSYDRCCGYWLSRFVLVWSCAFCLVIDSFPFQYKTTRQLDPLSSLFQGDSKSSINGWNGTLSKNVMRFVKIIFPLPSEFDQAMPCTQPDNPLLGVHAIYKLPLNALAQWMNWHQHVIHFELTVMCFYINKSTANELHCIGSVWEVNYNCAHPSPKSASLKLQYI